jgi:hypothetical protein
MLSLIITIINFPENKSLEEGSRVNSRNVVHVKHTSDNGQYPTQCSHNSTDIRFVSLPQLMFKIIYCSDTNCTCCLCAVLCALAWVWNSGKLLYAVPWIFIMRFLAHWYLIFILKLNVLVQVIFSYSLPILKLAKIIPREIVNVGYLCKKETHRRKELPKFLQNAKWYLRVTALDWIGCEVRI